MHDSAHKLFSYLNNKKNLETLTIRKLYPLGINSTAFFRYTQDISPANSIISYLSKSYVHKSSQV